MGDVFRVLRSSKETIRNERKMILLLLLLPTRKRSKRLGRRSPRRDRGGRRRERADEPNMGGENEAGVARERRRRIGCEHRRSRSKYEGD